MLFQKLPRFNPKSSRGLIAKMEKTLDVHSAFLENIKADSGILIRKNADGGITIESVAKSVGAGTPEDYAFKVTATEDLDNGTPLPLLTIINLQGMQKTGKRSPRTSPPAREPLEALGLPPGSALRWQTAGKQWGRTG